MPCLLWKVTKTPYVETSSVRQFFCPSVDELVELVTKPFFGVLRV